MNFAEIQTLTHHSKSQKKHVLSFFFSILPLLCFLFLLPILTSCESKKIIVNGLDEREANEIIVFLATKGIDATKVQTVSAGGGGGGNKAVTWDISVDTAATLEAMSYLNQAGLPRRRGENLLSIFTGTGLVPSELEQKIRYQAGLAAQIASTIRKIDGILDAEVQISFPEEDPLNPNKKKQPITASVYVKHNGILDDPNSHLPSKIKRLVAASVPGLDYDNVTVIGERAQFSSIGLGQSEGIEQEKQYVSVWSIVIAKDSLFRFRMIFFSLLMTILLLLMGLVWMLWKYFPTIKEKGFKELFKLHSSSSLPSSTNDSSVAPQENKESSTDTENDEDELADKDVDQT